MSAIDQVFRRCADEGRAAFIPFLMGGDPDLRSLPRLLEALAAGGADLIEVGVPFSDPIADGPVNQRAAGRALASGTSLGGILGAIATARESVDVPIVLFSYFNPIRARGVELFAEQAVSSGVDGVLCVDLPPEEAEETYLPALARNDLDPVFLLAPTSTVDRMKRVGEVSRGFVYYVSRTGVTGERELLTKTLPKEVKRVRRKVDLPVAVGFGISSPDQVEAVGEIADGVVVGSALVRLVEEATGAEEGWSEERTERLAGRLEERVRELCGGLQSERKKRRRA
jgi:tryptophan synthase alpha chain